MVGWVRSRTHTSHIFAQPWCFNMSPTPSYSVRGPVGVVIAHPDDESMFFAPALTALEGRGERAFVLCLSSGTSFGGHGNDALFLKSEL